MTIIGAINDVVHVTKPAATAMPPFTLTTHTKPPTTTLDCSLIPVDLHRLKGIPAQKKIVFD
jgi:hypothetical protein